MATFCSESSVGGFPFPEVHRLCLVFWERAIALGLAKLKRGCGPIWDGDSCPWGCAHFQGCYPLCSQLSPP